jgi:hypothetical protein
MRSSYPPWRSFERKPMERLGETTLPARTLRRSIGLAAKLLYPGYSRDGVEWHTMISEWANATTSSMTGRGRPTMRATWAQSAF